MNNMEMIPAALLQRELLSCADAAMLGVTARDLDYAVRKGVIFRLKHGWYCPAPKPTEAEAVHRQDVEAALRSQPATMAGYGSALVKHGLAVRKQAIVKVHLIRVGEGEMYRVPYVVVHKRVPGLVISTNDRVVSPATACVQAALLDPVSGLMAADQALRRGVAGREELDRCLELYRAARGVVLARAALRLINPQRDSPRESELAYLCAQLGIDLDEQVQIQGKSGQTYRADGRIRGTRRLVEYDGRDKYASQQDLLAEKRREDDLRAAGWQFIRVTAELFANVPELARRLREP